MSGPHPPSCPRLVRGPTRIAHERTQGKGHPGLLHVVASLILLQGFSGIFGCQARIDSSTMPIPADLTIEGVAGGVHPWQENYTLRITADGTGRFTRFTPGEVGAPPLEENDFTLAREELAELWRVIEHQGFMSLAEDHRDDSIRGGSFASLTVTAHGRTRRVRVQNVSLPRFEAVIAALNRVSPTGNDLIYRSPDDTL